MGPISVKNLEIEFWKKHPGVWVEYRDGTNIRGFITGFRFSEKHPGKAIGFYCASRKRWGNTVSALYVSFASIADYAPCDDVCEL